MKKRIILGILSLVSFFAFTFNVEAGNVTLGFLGNDTVVVNNNLEIIVKASDINGLTQGMATAQGDISFDNNYLEFVKSEDVSNTLSVSYGTKTKRFVALGLSGEYIPSAENLLKLTFKAKQVGSTTLGINNVVIGDTKAIIHGSNVLPKTINIVNENNEPSNPVSSNKPSTSTNKPSKAPSKPASNTSKSSDASLTKLLINSSKMNPAFNKDVTTYEISVSKDINKLQIDYATSDSKAKVNIVGNNGLKDGQENIVEIIVTAEDGTTKTYTLKVTKTEEIIDNKLKSLDVKESRLTFDEDNFEYNLTVGSNVNKLTIDAIPKSKYSTVKIIGNNKLGKGNNLVLIKLTDKNGYTNFYKLNVKKESSFKIFGISVKYILYFVFLLLLLLLLFFVFLLILVLLKRRKKKKKQDNIAKQELAKEEVYVVKKDDLEKLKEPKSQFKPEEDNVDIYDDIVTKDELIDAIEERNPKKLKMLLAQEEANKLKEELMQEEQSEESE